MHVINIHASYMSSMNSRYHKVYTKYTTLLTLTECTKRSQVCDPKLHQTCGIKVGLSTYKFNKWLKKPYLNTSPPRGNQSADWDYTSLVLILVFILRAPGRIHLRDRWVHLKHKLSKREYKGVLSKTYRGAILLMHMFQGKGRWGLTCRSFDLANPELRVPDLR